MAQQRFEFPLRRLRVGTHAEANHQHAIEPACKGKRREPVKRNQPCIVNSDARELLPHHQQSMRVKISSHYVSRVPRSANQRRGLSSRRGAQIQHPLSRPHIKKQRHHL